MCYTIGGAAPTPVLKLKIRGMGRSRERGCSPSTVAFCKSKPKDNYKYTLCVPLKLGALIRNTVSYSSIFHKRRTKR